MSLKKRLNVSLIADKKYSDTSWRLIELPYYCFLKWVFRFEFWKEIPCETQKIVIHEVRSNIEKLRKLEF